MIDKFTVNGKDYFHKDSKIWKHEDKCASCKIGLTNLGSCGFSSAEYILSDNLCSDCGGKVCYFCSKDCLKTWVNRDD